MRAGARGFLPPFAVRRRTAIWVATTLALLAIAWAVADLGLERIGFAATIPPKLRGAEEAASAFARLFGALALALYPADAVGRRLHWVAAAFVVLGAGHFFYGYLVPLLGELPDPNQDLFAGLLIRTLAGVLLVVGLLPSRAPRFGARAVLALLLSLLAGGAVLESLSRTLGSPKMVALESFRALAEGGGPTPGLTGLHWTLSLAPLALCVVAAWAAASLASRGEIGGWIVLATVLLAATQLHHALWPTAYGSAVLTSADLLRFAFAATVAVGGLLELRRMAAERWKLLAAERERAKSLEELQAMKANFTAMVAHELSSPILAVRSLSAVLARSDLEPGRRERLLGMLDGEADRLAILAEDVKTSAEAEMDDFRVVRRPISVSNLLEDAASFVETLPGGHPFEVVNRSDGVEILADSGRIGQVLRNLLRNAVEYSPEGTPVTLTATRDVSANRVRFSVSDAGLGIRPEELPHVFEKFYRGRNPEGNKPAGTGLGLYLSRRIVRSHGGDIMAESDPDEGATFHFDLEVIGR